MTTMTQRERLHHAINAWAATRSDAHAAALNAEVDAACSAIDRLEQHADRQALQIDDLRTAFSQLQQRFVASSPEVIRALSDLCEAYRARAGLDGAWDEPLVRAEAAVIAARSINHQTEGTPS